jgi:oligopeptide transport system substrate-binding protein
MLKKFLCLILCFIFTVSCSNSKPNGKDFLFTVSIVENPDSLDPQLASNISAYNVISNIFAGITAYDEDGKIILGVAENYTISEDNLEYTFKLGENFWNGKTLEKPVPLIADDFVFAFERKKIDSVSNIIAIDENTVKYILNAPNPDFLTILTLPAAMPCSRKLFENCKGRYGLDEESIPSNGSFYVEKWQYDPYGKDNVIWTKRNNSNLNTSPSRLNYRILENYDETIQRFKDDKEIGVLKLNSYDKILENYKYFDVAEKTIGFISNDEQLSKILAENTPRDKNSAFGIIPPAVNFKGKSYRELVNEKTIPNSKNSNLSYQTENDIQILTCTDIADTSLLYNAKNQYEKVLNCQISFDICDLEEYTKRLNDEDYTICVVALTADYNSPFAFFKQFGYYENTGNIDDYTKIEREIVNNGKFIPLFYSSVYVCFKEKLDCFVYIPYTEQLNFKYAKNYRE